MLVGHGREDAGMDPGEGPSRDPFKRSSRISRSPTRRTMSVPEGRTLEAEGSESEQLQVGRKRKENFSPPSLSTRRRILGEDGDEEDAEVGIDVPESTVFSDSSNSRYAQIKTLGEDLARWALNQYKNKKLVNPQLVEIRNKVTDMLTLVASAEKEALFMAGRLAERTEIESAIKRSVGVAETVRMPTFADALKNPRAQKMPKITGVTKVTAPKVMFVRSADEKVDLEEVKNVVKRSIRPSQLGVNIKRVVKTARGVLIEAEGLDQLDKIRACAQLADKGLTFEKPKKRNPRIMIYDVDMPEDPNELIEDVYKQNIESTEIDIDTFKTEFKCVHTYKRKDPKDLRVTMVAECSARVRNLVRARDRLYIGWQSCRVKDFNPLVRCFKCQSFGHVAKYCRGKHVCPHCAEDHEAKECKNGNRPPKCANCSAAKKNPDHSINDPKCPEFARATKIAHERIDYGN